MPANNHVVDVLINFHRFITHLHDVLVEDNY